MKSVAFHNLGCKVNAYETEAMRRDLENMGYRSVPFDEEADVYIVNTCSVTNIADKKSRQMLHRARRQNPDAVVVAVGCYAQTGRPRLESDPDIDLVIGNSHKSEIPQILEEFFSRRESEPHPSKTLDGGTVSDMTAPQPYERLRRGSASGHTRAFIKIQDGCDQFCSYCVIPFARGRTRSRDLRDVLAEAGELADAGYREVVLTGIHVSSYGADFADKTEEPVPLLSLASSIARIPGIERIRLGSLEPGFVTEQTVARLADIPKLCPHFHLSLQSGCDETLRRMNRHYTTAEYEEKLGILRRNFDNPALTTDVIAGFPGESEEEFEKTYAFLEKIRLYEMHVFPYSRREGTLADRLPGQVSRDVKERRAAALLALTKKQATAYRAGWLGRPVVVLLEEDKVISGRRYWLGHTDTYVKAAVADMAGCKAGRLARAVPERFLSQDTLLLGAKNLEFCD